MSRDWGDWLFESFLRLMLVVFGAAALFAAVSMGIAIASSRVVGRTTCHNFAVQTGYRTKFEVLNFFDTGTCLARTPDGHWTKNTNIIVNVPVRKP